MSIKSEVAEIAYRVAINEIRPEASSALKPKEAATQILALVKSKLLEKQEDSGYMRSMVVPVTAINKLLGDGNG